MAVLQWGNTKQYESGVDRGVLFLADGTAVAWNGLTSVQEESESSSVLAYLDGRKYLDYQIPQDFSATLTAYTYPDEFEKVLSYAPDQESQIFSLSYRTSLANGYKIHIIYNANVDLSNKSYQSQTESTPLVEFSWPITTTPIVVEGFRPTAHLVFDTTLLDGDVVAALQDILYGTDTTDPVLPDAQDLINELVSLTNILIIDNGDGTWTAVGPAEDVYLTDSTTFEIDNVDAEYSDNDTYSVSTTAIGG